MLDDFYHDRLIIDDPFTNRVKRVTTSLLLFLIAFMVAHLVHQLLLDGIANILMYISRQFTKIESVSKIPCVKIKICIHVGHY